MWRSVLWPPSFNLSSAYSLLGNQLSVISLVLSHASKAEFVPDSLSARYVFLLFTWVTSGRTEWSGAIFFKSTQNGSLVAFKEGENFVDCGTEDN